MQYLYKHQPLKVTFNAITTTIKRYLFVVVDGHSGLILIIFRKFVFLLRQSKFINQLII